MPSFPEGAVDVTTEEGALEAAGRLSPPRELAVDVEADSMHAFRARLCFAQVASDQAVFLFDTLSPGVRADVLAPLFADASRTKFFHAAGGDLQFLAEAGVRLQGLFDTHRAATLLGLQRVGLADLVHERLGARLKKEHQQADFSVRPLPAELREYIADDVRFLLELGRQVREQCLKADILEEVQLDCQRLADEAASRPEAVAPKVGKGSLSPAQYALAAAIVRELHLRRLAWAEAADLPMGKMLSNAALLALAARPPATEKELKRVPGVRGAFVREHGEEALGDIRRLWEASRRGDLVVEAEERPRDGRRRKREEALRAFRAEKAAERGVTPSVVLPNALLEELAKEPPGSMEELSRVPYFGEKRLFLYGRQLLELLKATG
ncbi:MAG: HRDC domain-containing protein [Myxococcales bacterium]|nr:HRDC domain-containing protein [Myxococcales bacterium]